MAYAHSTLADACTEISEHLGDPGQRFWCREELSIYVVEALRTWNSFAQFHRRRGVFNTVAGTAFYDLGTVLPSLLGRTATNRETVKSLQYSLLEPATPLVWSGTDQFTLSGLIGALEKQRDQFLLDTGTVVLRTVIPYPPSPIGRVVAPDSLIDLRRLAWIRTTGAYDHLWRVDEDQLNSYSAGWSVNPATPSAYSVICEPPLQIQLAPIPDDAGQLETIAVWSGASLATSSDTPLGLFDDHVWVAKWAALGQLLSDPGPAFDPQRADYAEKRYAQAVQFIRGLPSVLQAEINGLPVPLASLYELDSMYPGWQNATDQPQGLAIAGNNLVAVWPMPDAAYSVTVDVAASIPVPVNFGDSLQVGREHLAVILDYAAHLAAFKIGGAEWAATMGAHQALLASARRHNLRLRAQAANYERLHEQPAKEEIQRPALVEA